LAATIQAAATAWPTQPTRIRIGSRDRADAGRRPRALLLRALVLRVLLLPLLLVLGFGRAVVRVAPERPEAAAGLRRAGPGGSARKSPELPPRCRVDSLGARVAMMTT
jgi:hypothetical protein